MSDIEECPSEGAIRHTAVLLAAADHALSDDMDPDEALAFAQLWFGIIDTDQMWADGRHEGDCTKTAMTCSRCVRERYEDEARARWDA